MNRLLKYFLLPKDDELQLEYYEYAQNYLAKTPENIKKRFNKISELRKKEKIKQDVKNYRFEVPVDEFVEKLMPYDVVSFDIFDTLLFRYFDRPVDVFLYMEAKYEFVFFQSLRIAAEQMAREKSKFKEVTIYEIYDVLREQCNIDTDIWMMRELQAEEEICFANPYMKEVVDRLKKAGKKVIATSDMYIPKKLMKKLLISCGYDGLDEIYVSCDYRCGKSDGRLYEEVIQSLEIQRNQMIHVGDNYQSDVLNARKQGLNVVYYPNVNRPGSQLHNDQMSSIVGGIYRGIVNQYLNSGYYSYNDYFKYGFTVGGILNYGYCQWIEHIAAEKKIDKILFVARDGYIMKETYDKYFAGISTAYVYFSRFCAQQVMFESYTESYLQQTLVCRIRGEKSEPLHEILKELELTFLEPYMKKAGMNTSSVLDEEMYEKVREFIYENKPLIVAQFNETVELTYQYYLQVIGDAKRILIVDLGWFGTCSVALTSLLNKKTKGGIKVFSALIGTNENPSVNARLANSSLDVYAFSSNKNSDVMRWHMWNQTSIHNMLTEILFTAPHPSFLNFKKENNTIVPVFGYEEEKNQQAIHDIQEGIRSFAEKWGQVPSDLKKIAVISGADAYAPAKHIMEKRKFCYDIFKNYEINELAGKFSEKNINTMGSLMKEYGYIKDV